MPVRSDQRRGAGTQRGDVVVQGLILISNGHSRIGPEVRTQPLLCAFGSADFAGLVISCAVRQPIIEAWRRHTRYAVEGRQRRQRAIEAVVASTWNGAATVVHQLPVGVNARVGADTETVSLTQRILDAGLM